MTGPTYPLILDSANNVPISSGSDLIKSSMAVILLTPKGTRPMFKDFGSELYKLKYMNSGDPAFIPMATVYILDPLATWLPEVTIAEILITPKLEDVVIDIAYLEPENTELIYHSIIFPLGGQ